MLKKVLIIHPEGNSFNNPTIKCIIDLFCDHDVDVHILHQKTSVPMPPYRGIKYHPWGRAWGRIKNIVLNKISSKFLCNVIFYCESIVLPRDFDLIVGVDREGLIESSYFSRLRKTPYVFFSFEIMFESETSSKIKELEKNASKNVSKWFVQDEERSGLLIKENSLDPLACIKLPVASKGEGFYTFNRLRDSLGIPAKCKVAMLMGSLSNWSMTTKVLQTIKNWPIDWCLIIHDRYGKTHEYLDANGPEDIRIVKDKIFVSNASVKFVDDMGYVLAGVDLGLAFYEPDYSGIYTGKNLKYLGLSSGKISTFLRYNIPVIMNDIGVYAKCARNNSFGLVIKDLNKLGNSLDVCRELKRGNSPRIFFLKHLDFNNYQDNIWHHLNSVN